MQVLLLASFLIPLIGGAVMYFLKANRKVLGGVLFSLTGITFLLSFIMCFASSSAIHLFNLTPTLSIDFNVDGVSKFFALTFSGVFFLVSFYSYKYMDKEENENHFYSFFLLSLAMLIQLCYSYNLVTMYLSFEMVTLVSMPLVMHEKTKESISAALKYLYYSIGGAFLGLLGLFFFYYYAGTSTLFTLGGVLDLTKVGTNNTLFQVVILLTLIGFGAKAGMFPLHGWLPTAHPVAPAPASGVLSGIITKAGVISVIRIIYYVIGTPYLLNTWVQYTYIGFILLTILLGSFMAMAQKNLKKRLAYSSVSQISYVLLGIAMMNEDAISGSFLHIASHATIKVTLFLVAGAIIYYTSYHDVDELKGIGKKLPITMVTFTIASLGLIGIPPLGGFVSKWYLATGSISSGLQVVNIIAPIVLLISAILTAGYLLPICIDAFIVGDSKEDFTRIKESKLMIIPLIILCVAILGIGVFASPIVDFIKAIF